MALYRAFWALMASSVVPTLITTTTFGKLPPCSKYSTRLNAPRWEPFDPARNWPDLGTRLIEGERRARGLTNTELPADDVENDQRDLSWATVLKRTFEAYIRGERPNMYGEWIAW